MWVRVLGSAAGGGFPQWNCGCPQCRAVRDRSRPCRSRTQSSIAVSARLEQPIGRLFVVGARYDEIVDRTDFIAHYQGGLTDYGGFAKHVAMVLGAVRF